MTWEQFAAVVLGIAATALVRLLDKYLPRTEDHPALAAAAEPMAGPPRTSTPSTSEGPPEGYAPPEPGHGPPTAS